MSDLTETRFIELPKGGVLSVQMSPEFLHHVAEHFDVEVDEVDDEHIRMFVWGATKNALDKAERDDAST